jgi:hypothetical protein
LVKLFRNRAGERWELNVLISKLGLPAANTVDDACDAGLKMACEFLEKLRPGGPWVLIAIVPDGAPTGTTAFTADQVVAFIRAHNGKANLYYQVNPTRTPMFKKAAKTDIAAIEFIPVDLDPRAGETRL